MPASANQLRAKLAQADGPLMGMFLGSASPVIAELAAGAGLDWLLIDGEHGASEPGDYLPQLRAAAGRGMDMILRLPVGETHLVKRALDMGAQSLLIPMVHTGEQADELAAMCKYPPQGIRGLGANGARASNFSRISDYAKTANDQVFLMVQAESRAAIDNIDAIAGADGVDCVFIGPSDLSADMGHLGNPSAPEVEAAIDHAIARIRAAGKVAAIYSGDITRLPEWREKGVGMVALGTDVSFFAKSLDAFVAKARAV